MSKLKDKAAAAQPAIPSEKVQIKEVKPAVQNPDQNQKGRSIDPPGKGR